MLSIFIYKQKQIKSNEIIDNDIKKTVKKATLINFFDFLYIFYFYENNLNHLNSYKQQT